MNEKILLTLRDVTAAVAIVGIILASLWAYTGQFPDTPMVVVTSGSMMHDNAPYGKVGTIDPGDLVLVKKISGRDGVATRGEDSNPATTHRTYGDYGDVIIYRPMGNEKRTPIIHRAICWVEYKGGTYTVKEYGIENAPSINIPELHISSYKPSNSGFITKGDNNELPDQYPGGGICAQPIKPEWVIGKARGELPWFGMIKLMISGTQGVNAEDQEWVRVGNAVAPKDIWVCLGLSLLAISAIPISMDAYEYYKKKYKEESG
jgi:signal peptidase